MPRFLCKQDWRPLRLLQTHHKSKCLSLSNLNVSGLEQTARFLLNKIVWFHLDAPRSQAGARKPRGFDIRIGSSIKSQAKFQTAARRESTEDSMKRALMLIVVPALLVALGFAQTPAASINTDRTIKGCLGARTVTTQLWKTARATFSRSPPTLSISSNIWAMT